MTTTTTTGSAALTTLMVSAGTDLIVPQYQSVSLLQDADATVTGSGHTVIFLGRVETTNDNQCQVEIDVNGTAIYADATGNQIIARTVLSAGSHTIAFSAFALGNDVVAEVFGLTVIDLGL